MSNEIEKCAEGTESSGNYQIILFDCELESNRLELFEKYEHYCLAISSSEEVSTKKFVMRLRKENNFRELMRLVNNSFNRHECGEVMIKVLCYKILTTVEDVLNGLMARASEIVCKPIEEREVWIVICTEKEWKFEKYDMDFGKS